LKPPPSFKEIFKAIVEILISKAEIMRDIKKLIMEQLNKIHPIYIYSKKRVNIDAVAKSNENTEKNWIHLIYFTRNLKFEIWALRLQSLSGWL
jgi:predicted patatin/cPLA2 family phospholipase